MAREREGARQGNSKAGGRETAREGAEEGKKERFERGRQTDTRAHTGESARERATLCCAGARACPIQILHPSSDSRVRRKGMPGLAARLDEKEATEVVIGRLNRSTLPAY